MLQRTSSVFKTQLQQNKIAFNVSKPNSLFGSSKIVPTFGLTNQVRFFTTENAKTTLFVANFPWKTDENQIGNYLSQFGKVFSVDLKRHEDGRLKGFGFVEVEPEDAPKILEAANEKEFGGRPLVLKNSKEREPRPPRERRERRFNDEEEH